MPYEWTPGSVERLKTLWRQGMTSRDIAYKIGGNLTRNAVIGKANRLGLSGGGEQGSKARTPKKNATPPPSTIRHKCQWPFGDPDKEGFRFCEKPTFQTRPYCQEHCLLAYRRTIVPKSLPEASS